MSTQTTPSSDSAIEIADESQETTLPVLPSSEMDKNQGNIWPVQSTSKLQEGNSSCSNGRIYNETRFDLNPDLISIFESGSKVESENNHGFRYELKIDDIIWPVLSTSEMQESTTKRARHTTSCSIGIIHADASIDLDEFACKEGAKRHTETGTLRRSSNLCSPFVLGDRGCELWRDFL